MPKYTFAIKQTIVRYYTINAQNQEAGLAAIKLGLVRSNKDFQESPDYKHALVTTEEEN